METHKNNLSLRAKYSITARFYDILDFPWERIYRVWRSQLLHDIRGNVLEAGCGTGRNFAHYHSSVHLTAIDLSTTMLRIAEKRARKAPCQITLKHKDAVLMKNEPSNHYDWIISTFMCCVMPDNLQPLALEQFNRILKPGGRFRLLEIIYSSNPRLRRRQKLWAPWVEKIYGARFDRQTLHHLKKNKGLEITRTKFLKDDTYLLIEGHKKHPLEEKPSRHSGKVK